MKNKKDDKDKAMHCCFVGIVVVLSAILFASLHADAKLNVVTTTTDLAALVDMIGANTEAVEVFSIAMGTQDPHQIEPKPSFMVKMRNADLVVAQGLDLESAWLGPLLKGARNPKINVATNGYLELGEKLQPLEVATAAVTRAQGDVHPSGNPHFTLDPVRLMEAATLISQRMGDLDSVHRELYKKNASQFQSHMKDKVSEWKSRVEKTKVKAVVTYHKTLSYFFDRFGLTNELLLEPRPGIPPTAAHLLSVIAAMRSNRVRLVMIENFFDERAGDKVKREVPNAHVVSVAVSVGGFPNIKTNEQLIEQLVKTIEDSAK